MNALIEFGPYAGGVLSALSGLFALLFPRLTLGFLGRTPDAGIPNDFLRVQVGGMQLFLGLFCLYSRSPSSFWTVGFAWLGTLLMRVIQANFFGQSYAWRPAFLELAICLLMLASFFVGYA